MWRLGIRAGEGFPQRLRPPTSDPSAARPGPASFAGADACRGSENRHFIGTGCIGILHSTLRILRQPVPIAKGHQHFLSTPISTRSALPARFPRPARRPGVCPAVGGEEARFSVGGGVVALAARLPVLSATQHLGDGLRLDAGPPVAAAVLRAGVLGLDGSTHHSSLAQLRSASRAVYRSTRSMIGRTISSTTASRGAVLSRR